ncbi:MAG: hypothetical protein M3011_12590 [Actinomycetota bacterium]|nr:hypothetical protein [Actinomycetota bacterium]
MAEPHTPESLTDAEVAVHTVPLAADGKVMIFIEANAHVTHVMSLTPSAAQQLVLGLLEAIDVVGLSDPGWPFDDGPIAA